MAGRMSSWCDAAEQGLLGERQAVGAWLIDLEKRAEADDRLCGRVLRARRLLGKLEGRIRVVREVARARGRLLRGSFPGS